MLNALPVLAINALSHFALAPAIISLVWAIASLATIACHFPVNGGLMTAKEISNLSLRLTGCLKNRNLASFLSGKLRVVTHRAPLTLVGERSREPTAAYPSNLVFRVAPTSCIHGRLSARS